jgi:hypothetical protein
MVDTVFKMEGKEEMRVRNELHIMRDEMENGRRHVMLRKVEIAEALLQWREEMEAEKRECEEEIAKREAFAKSLERPLENMAELLDSRWLHDVWEDELPLGDKGIDSIPLKLGGGFRVRTRALESIPLPEKIRNRLSLRYA